MSSLNREKVVAIYLDSTMIADADRSVSPRTAELRALKDTPTSVCISFWGRPSGNPHQEDRKMQALKDLPTLV
jgi:hypothetical protein